MTVKHNEGAYVVQGQPVNFTALLAGVRDLKPRCTDCGIALQESVTGIRTRLDEAGQAEKLCRSCAISEIGERLVQDLPR